MVKNLFGNSVDAGSNAVKLDFPGAVGVDRPVKAVAGDIERNARHITVLGSFYDLHAAQADFHIEIAFDGVGDRLRIGHKVLLCPIRPNMAVRPGNDTPALGIVFGGGNGNRAVRRCFGGNGQLVAADGAVNAGGRSGKGIIAQDVVGVGQRGAIPCAIPNQLNVLHLAGAAGKEAGQFGVGLNIGGNAVVVVHDLVTQRMVGADLVDHRSVTAGADLVERGVALTDDCFPNQELGRRCVGQLIAALILREPAGGNGVRVAVLHNAANEQLDVIGCDGLVVAGRVVVPKILAPVYQLIARIKTDTGFDAVADRPRVGSHCAHNGLAGRTG